MSTCVFFIDPQKWPCQRTPEILMEARPVLGLFWSLGKFQVLEAVVYWTSTPLSFCDSEGNVRKQFNKKLGPQFCPQENMQEAKQMSFIIPEKKDGVPNRRAQSPTEGGQKFWLPHFSLVKQPPLSDRKVFEKCITYSTRPHNPFLAEQGNIMESSSGST